MNLIGKMILSIALLMTPVIIMYMYSSQMSIRVVEEQINISNQNRLGYFLEEIEGTLNQVANYSNIITKDPDFAELAGNALPANRYDYSALVENIERKLGLFSLSTDRMTRINLYFPASRQAVSSHSSIVYDDAYLSGSINPSWNLRSVTVNGLAKRAFTRYFIEPYAGLADYRKASIIVEVDLMEDNIVAMLDSFKSKGNNDPFLYKAPGGYVLNGTSDVNMAKEIVHAYELEANTPRNSHKIVTLHNKKYLVYFFNSSKINWTLVDYVPFEDILAPVTKSRSLFYITVGLLVLVGAGAVFLMYVHVQVPIKLLTASVSKLKMGVFSSRVQSNPNREFQALFVQFNEMAGRIQYLVEKVYLEEIRAKEAVMKQLQSQINPHFLYNSLAYVVSMAKLNRPQPIVSMAYSLADYYRYTTRNDSIETTLQEELAFVASYVDIMNHQLGKIRFELEVPPSMNRILIPRLLIQPIVENAIVHGLEEQPDGGTIRISGSEEQEAYEITIEDDGVGLPNSDLDRLNEKLNYAVTDGESFGLWNVNQRLRYQFGKRSGVTVKRSASGGLKVVLRWYHNGSSEQGGNDVLDSNC